MKVPKNTNLIIVTIVIILLASGSLEMQSETPTGEKSNVETSHSLLGVLEGHLWNAKPAL